MEKHGYEKEFALVISVQYEQLHAKAISQKDVELLKLKSQRLFQMTQSEKTALNTLDRVIRSCYSVVCELLYSPIRFLVL